MLKIKLNGDRIVSFIMNNLYFFEYNIVSM